MNMSSFTIFDQSSSAFISGESHISPVFARRNTAAALKQFHKVLLVLIADGLGGSALKDYIPGNQSQ